MSKKKGSWVTAEAFMEELQRDPEYQRRMAERERVHEEHVARVRVAIQPVLVDLRKAGLDVQEWGELVPEYVPLPPRAIDVLLSWLPRVKDDDVKEMIVRALAATVEPFDGRPLARAFEQSSNESLRWAIGNTFAVANPIGVGEWVVDAAADPGSGNARETLAEAVARLAPSEVANDVLASLLEEMPVSAAKGFAICGGAPELALLEDRLGRTKEGWIRKDLEKAMRSIRKRMGRARGT